VEILELNHRLQTELRRREEAEAAIRELNHTLERRVEERTAELRAANEFLAHEIGERSKAQAEAVRYSAQLQDLTRRYVGVQEEERRKLARELHDNVSSSLSAVGLSLDMIARERSQEAATMQERLADAMELLKEAIATTRTISFDLHPALLDYSGVVPALEDYGRRYARRTGIRVDVAGLPIRLPGDCEIALYRIAQEALTNCAKHAHASRVAIELKEDEGRIELAIADDGTGFDAAAFAAGAPSGVPGLGLLAMKERAEAIGATLAIESRYRRGTRITVSLASPAKPQPAS